MRFKLNRNAAHIYSGSFLQAYAASFKENNSIRNGGWQESIGEDLSGKILGVLRR